MHKLVNKQKLHYTAGMTSREKSTGDSSTFIYTSCSQDSNYVWFNTWLANGRKKNSNQAETGAWSRQFEEWVRERDSRCFTCNGFRVDVWQLRSQEGNNFRGIVTDLYGFVVHAEPVNFESEWKTIQKDFCEAAAKDEGETKTSFFVFVLFFM